MEVEKFCRIRSTLFVAIRFITMHVIQHLAAFYIVTVVRDTIAEILQALFEFNLNNEISRTKTLTRRVRIRKV